VEAARRSYGHRTCPPLEIRRDRDVRGREAQAAPPSTQGAPDCRDAEAAARVVLVGETTQALRAARHSTFDGAAFPDAPGGDRRGCPELNSLPATGTDYSATLLVFARTNSERLGSENSFDSLCGVTPAEACSGKVVRHRFNLM
jgi:hypothetical protein